MTQMPRSCKNYRDYLPSNEEAEEIELLVKEMAEHNNNMALALRCQYFSYGGCRVKAKKLKISHMKYKLYVDMAHQWLIGRLSANNKIRRKFLVRNVLAL